jgi:DNA gyrase/topoisomerase IV subunit B
MGSFASVSLARLTPLRHPKTGRLLRVEIADQIVIDCVINELMGKDASARFRLI